MIDPKILIIFSIALILSLVAIPLLIKLGHRYNLLDHPGQHKRHKQPTPYLGGIGLFVVCWLTVLLGWLVFPSYFSELKEPIIFILLGSMLIGLVGFSDDMKPMSAWVKLLAQIGAGLLIYWGGLRVDLVNVPFFVVDMSRFSMIVTILWVVGLTNAINLIDGLDGLAGGVSLIAAVFLFVVSQLKSVGAVVVFLPVLISYLLVFWYYNRYPAKIFLGDSGSMQIGYLFAVFSLAYSLKSYATAALYIPMLALGVPILEISTSFFRRLISGKNVMKADRRHLFHYLALFGLSPKQIVWVFYLLALVYGSFALAMFFWDRMLVFSFLLIFMVVIFALFFIFMVKFIPRKKL